MTVDANVYDMSRGCPVVDARLRWEALVGTRWQVVATACTDSEGKGTFGGEARHGRGTYRLVCETDPYYAGLGMTAAYPDVVVPFRVLREPYRTRITVLVATSGYTVYLG